MSETERFANFSLTGLLPENSKLVVNREQRILTQLRSTATDCVIVEQQTLTDTEIDLVLALLEWHPYHCPLENILAAYSGRSVEQCRKQINRALEEGLIDGLMRPARNRLSLFRPKLHVFGLDARSIIETGYMLIADTGKLHGNRKGGL